MMMSLPDRQDLRAIIWDFDGTLVDTRAKNLEVTRKIVKAVTGRAASEYPVLGSLASYEAATRQATNWRDLYMSAFQFTERETDDAGALWTEYQLNDDTPAPVFDGIADALRQLDGMPHGIVSQNSHQNIRALLASAGIAHRFEYVVGYEEVELARQKPEPDGLLMCIERLTGFDPGVVLYVGDHEADVECASNANRVLLDRGVDVRILSVAAHFSENPFPRESSSRPAYEAHHPRDIVRIVELLMIGG